MKLILPLLTILLTGCVIHSIQPIGSEKSQIVPKNLIGHWRLVRGLSGTDLTGKQIGPWELAETDNGKKAFQLVAFDEENARAEFEARFFQIGAARFMDYVAGDLGDEVKLNAYWRMSVHPVHGVAKVVATDDELRFQLLNYNWVKSGLRTKTLTLPYSGNLDDFILITATSSEWETFLTKHGNDTNAFPTEAAFVLKRITGKKPSD